MMEGQTATIDEHLHETKITNKKKESYKTTEFGFIPEIWKVVKFENVLNLFNGYAFKSADAVKSSNTQLIRMGNLYQNKLDLERKPIFYPDSYAQKYSKYVLQEGDLIISLTGTSEKEDYGFTVKINKTNKKLLLNQRVARIDIISADVNRDYIFYFLLSRMFLTPLFLTAKGMKQANLSTNAIKKLNVVIPPLEEQRKIARVLSLVQNAIAQQEQLITLTTELKKALMQKLFTEGTRGELQRETKIGVIPESWDLVPCSELCKTITVGVVVKPASYYVESGIPAFRSLNVREDQLVTENLVYFSPEDNDGKLAKSKVYAGDVLIVRTGYPGTSCVVPEQYEGSNCIDIVIARPKNTIFSKFLSRFFNSPAGKLQALSAKHGLAQQHLNVGAIKNILVPIPSSLNEQNEIAIILEYIDNKLIFYKYKKNLFTDLLDTLLHQLMTAQIRVDDLNLSTINLELQGRDNNNANL